MSGAGELRRELSIRGQRIAEQHQSVYELTEGSVPSVLFGRDGVQRHDNFHPSSFRNICSNADWARRLTKDHTASRRAGTRAAWRWKELDCANSSDALLMNVFCYRRAVANPSLCAMLGVAPSVVPTFGFKPKVPLRNGKTDRTEVDMKLGDVMVEAKLTESDFQAAEARKVERYRDFKEVFDPAELPRHGEIYDSYQLIRGALAAYVTGGSFCVICDSRRPDLSEKWYRVLRAVRNCELRCRLQLLTWQELSITLPRPLQRFLAWKYGIHVGLQSFADCGIARLAAWRR